MGQEKESTRGYFTGGDRFFNQMKEAGIADDDFVREIVEMFLTESKTTLMNLKEACKEEDLLKLQMNAHKLKSGLLMFDLYEEHKRAIELEEAVKFVYDQQANQVESLIELCNSKFDLLTKKYCTTI